MARNAPSTTQKCFLADIVLGDIKSLRGCKLFCPWGAISSKKCAVSEKNGKYQVQIQKLLFHLNSNLDFKGNCNLNRETVLDFRKECLGTWLSGQIFSNVKLSPNLFCHREVVPFDFIWLHLQYSKTLLIRCIGIKEYAAMEFEVESEFRRLRNRFVLVEIPSCLDVVIAGLRRG